MKLIEKRINSYSIQIQYHIIKHFTLRKTTIELGDRYLRIKLNSMTLSLFSIFESILQHVIYSQIITNNSSRIVSYINFVTCENGEN